MFSSALFPTRIDRETFERLHLERDRPSQAAQAPAAPGVTTTDRDSAMRWNSRLVLLRSPRGYAITDDLLP